jgi:hypothetical protein
MDFNCLFNVLNALKGVSAGIPTHSQKELITIGFSDSTRAASLSGIFYIECVLMEKSEIDREIRRGASSQQKENIHKGVGSRKIATEFEKKILIVSRSYYQKMYFIDYTINNLVKKSRGRV